MDSEGRKALQDWKEKTEKTANAAWTIVERGLQGFQAGETKREELKNESKI